jgi:hypothetical protein
MRAKTRTTAALLLLGALLLAAVSRAAAPAPTLERWVVAGGGGRGEAGAAVLEGTIGQSVVGRASSSPYALEAGFWAGLRGPQQLFLPVILRAAAP